MRENTGEVGSYTGVPCSKGDNNNFGANTGDDDIVGEDKEDICD